MQMWKLHKSILGLDVSARWNRCLEHALGSMGFHRNLAVNCLRGSSDHQELLFVSVGNLEDFAKRTQQQEDGFARELEKLRNPGVQFSGTEDTTVLLSQDWWNSTSYPMYFRTWNVVVHDWLYYYIYKDFLWLFGEKFKAVAMLSVFTLSAIVHEYVLAICCGYFCPVVFCLFMCSGMLGSIINDHRKGPIWNVFVWITLFFGQSFEISHYTLEWYAHKHCPLKNPTFLDYVKPRSWTCHIKV